MSWGTELWDQFDAIAQHSQKGIDFSERYAHFVKERCSIENEYAAKLKKLVKNYQPKKKEDETEFTYANGFQKMVTEVHDIANQHEVISENLSANVQRELVQLTQDLKQERRKYLQDGTKQQGVLQLQISALEKAKKQYEKAFKEAEKAQENYKKADADIHLSRAEVEKAKGIMTSKQQTCEQCKSEYAGELQKTNDCQKQHYTSAMPAIFQEMQDMDDRRISRIRESIKQSAEIERSVIPIIQTCITGMEKAAASVNSEEDSKVVVNKYKSGYVPPTDIPFEDLSNGNVAENHNHTNTPRTSLRPTDSIKGTYSGGKGKKRGGIFGIFGGAKTDDSKDDYSHLPPNQQKKKLNQKIGEFRQAIAKETAERDGMLKMRDVYVQNSQLGDPASLDKQLEDNAQKLDQLRHELQKYEGYLTEADNRVNPALLQTTTTDSTTHRMSNMSINSNQSDSPNQSRHSHHSHSSHSTKTNSLNSNSRSTSQHSNAAVTTTTTTAVTKVTADRTSNITIADQDSFEELEDDYPIIGTCQAQYSFDGPNEGSISMTEGETFSILEQDQGDGWTRVKRQATGEEGFVPTSYVKCTFYQQ